MSYTATIGFFDGVHCGHRYLIGQLLDAAAWRQDLSAIITFEQHPRNASLLTPYDERITRLKATGVNEIFCFQFPVIQGLTAVEFLHILREQCDVRTLLCGYDHRFGCDRKSATELHDEAIRAGIELMPIGPSPEGEMSSSRIRTALTEGYIEEANNMLGYAYTLTGQVVHGKAIGRTIGFPTANLRLPEGKLLPKSGVYATQGGIVNISHNGLVEVHYCEVQRDLYEQTISVPLLRRIRDEREFASLDELKAQIEKDILMIDEIPSNKY